MPEILIDYTPREQFEGFHERAQRWALIVAHRRAGKTVADVNDLIRGACTCPLPKPRFAYIAPTYTQAKDIAWEYLKYYTHPIPGVEQRESDLMVNFPNGGRVRLYGAEKYERLRGLYLDGCVIDEAAQIDPRAWPEVLRPALSDRKGWATFTGTPAGRNWFHALYKQALSDPEWFTLVLKASETGIVDEKELADARKMLTPEQFDQEFECSFDAAILGAYYAAEMRQAADEKRIGRVSYDPAVPVWTSWDLGYGDSTAIWFAQMVGTEIHVIDYLEASQQPLSWYVQQLKEKPYIYGRDILPHDAEAHEHGTGKTRNETLRNLGRDTKVLPRQKIDDGINAVRMSLARCWFDEEKCARGLETLRNYRSEYVDKLQVFRPVPVHDWACHGADSFRYLIEGLEPVRAFELPALEPMGYV